MIKKLTFKVLEALAVLIFIFVLGIIIPLLTSLFISIFIDDITIQDCMKTPMFWITTSIGWFLSTLYINHEIQNFTN